LLIEFLIPKKTANTEHGSGIERAVAASFFSKSGCCCGGYDKKEDD
jgi:hypothetical protein